jgi:hypothetical protein
LGVVIPRGCSQYFLDIQAWLSYGSLSGRKFLSKKAEKQKGSSFKLSLASKPGNQQLLLHERVAPVGIARFNRLVSITWLAVAN